MLNVFHFWREPSYFLSQIERKYTFDSLLILLKNTLKMWGYEHYRCQSENEARNLVVKLPKENIWPCHFTESNTTGEKNFEEFFTENEILDMERFTNKGIIRNDLSFL